MRKKQVFIGQMAIIFLLITFSKYSLAQKIDSSYVRKFPKENDIEITNNWNSTDLQFAPGQKHTRNDFHLMNNSVLYTGVNIDYKWLTVGYGFNVEQTCRYKKSHLSTLFFDLNNASQKVIWDVYFKKHYGFLTPDNFPKKTYSPLTGINLTDIGGALLFPLNSKRFSYSAARYLYNQQVKSAGSVILGVATYYHQFHSKDSLDKLDDKGIRGFIENNPKWMTVLLNSGYIYNFVWKKWSVSPEVELGYGKSVFMNSQSNIKTALQFKTNTTIGYSTPSFYAYASLFYHSYSHYFKIATTEKKECISLTAGYRIGSLKN